MTAITFGWLAAIFVGAAVLSSLLVPLLIRTASALHLYDAPDGVRRIHASPVPRLGGVAVYLAAAAIAAPILIYGSGLFWTDGIIAPYEVRMLTGLLIGSAILFVVGLVDDVRSLPASVKFVAQVVAAVIAWYFGAGLQTIALGYGEGVRLGFLELPLVLLWIIAVTNAYNFIDGLNGLAGGIAIVACATGLAVSLALGHFGVIIPTVALMGALFGFMRYNFPKARIFLGDAGSLSIGFLLSVLLLKASEAPGPRVMLAVPLLAMCVPLLDVSLAVLRRWLRGVPLSGADARHIHHRLMAIGMSARRTAIVLWVLAAAIGVFGLLIALTAPYVATSIAIASIIALCILIIYGTNILSYDELIVAGEVLFTAPSRFRRVISDQILAHDLTARIQSAEMVDEVTALLTSTAPSFGFLKMELVHDLRNHRTTEDDAFATWAWKLEYPLRPRPQDASSPSYKLAIWCSAEHHVRPYGAERAAKIIAPGLERWLLSRSADLNTPGAANFGIDEVSARLSGRRSGISKSRAR
ncbi:MAG TPA: MraY family glycosyltransferase [Gemmatimonadaceae bacterium]|nr:MraY family glycosyltransferase [Gemmatimonadaceae bacterium]